MLILSRVRFCNHEVQKSYNLTIEISQNLSNFIKYLDTNNKFNIQILNL
jgi:hypothetical protein